MIDFLKVLEVKNPILYFSGLISWGLAIVFMVVSLFDTKQVMGINAWIKPIKFFISIGLFNWTMAFYLSLLPSEMEKRISTYSIMVVIVFLIEMVIITGQAARGQLSHFNISTPLNGALFSLMGIAIMTLTVWTAITAIWFFKTPVPSGYSAGFWWGIRLGILLFAVFSFEGMQMASMRRHTIGAQDGGEGLPFLNWSKQYGDLRVAHFVGIHALQMLPLLGYFLLKRPGEMIFAAILYGGLSLWLFLRAMAGKPLM